MKHYIAALCTVLLALCIGFPLEAVAAGPALTTTEAYCIMDADAGLVLEQQNMDEELHPASITKVMTLGLACEKAQGNWDGKKLTVSHVVLVTDAVGVGKVGVRKAQFLHLCVHLLHAVRDGAAAEIFSQQIGTVKS